MTKFMICAAHNLSLGLLQCFFHTDAFIVTVVDGAQDLGVFADFRIQDFGVVLGHPQVGVSQKFTDRFQRNAIGKGNCSGKGMACGVECHIELNIA